MAQVILSMEEYLELLARAGGTTHSWSGYAPVPQAAPPAVWQGYAPVPVPPLAPVLAPPKTPEPIYGGTPALVPPILPYVVPHKKPMAVPQQVPQLQPTATEQSEPMLIPHYDAFGGVNSPSYLSNLHEDNFTDLQNMLEVEATHAAAPVYKEKLAEELAKAEQEVDSKKKQEARQNAYGEAMAAFMQAKYDNYAALMQENLAAYLQEQREEIADTKAKKKQLKEKRHQKAIKQIEAETAKKTKEIREND